MHFPLSGVDIFPLVPPLIALLVSTLTASAGISGAFLLLPFQVSVLHFTSPAVSPTNLIYNIIAIPGGLYRFIKEKRMAWPLTWVVTFGTLPGVFAGAWIRIYYLPKPRAFKLFVGIILFYLGYRLVSEIMNWNKKVKDQSASLNKKFAEQVTRMKETNSSRIASGLPAEAIIRTKTFSLLKVEYEFWGETYSFSTVKVFVLSLFVGLIGGIYGIGGGAIIAPFCVSVLGLPIYTVAGAALAGTLLTSVAGVAFYQIIAFTAVSSRYAVAPDWILGMLFGLGGLLGTYIGAYMQKYLPEKTIKILLAVLVLFLSTTYIVQFFTI